MSMAAAIHEIGVSEVTFDRTRKEYGGMKSDQLKLLKELEKENERLRRAVSDLTVDKLILTGTARTNFWAPADDTASALCVTGLASRSAGPVACLGQSFDTASCSQRLEKSRNVLSPT